MFNLWVASVDETPEPMTRVMAFGRLKDILIKATDDPDEVLAETVDGAVVSGLFKEWNGMKLFSYYGPNENAPKVRQVLNEMLSDPANAGKLLALGMWNVLDGQEWGGVIPWYPQPAELMHFMPDKMGASAGPSEPPEMIPRTEPADINLGEGQAPRVFTPAAQEQASAQGLLDFLISEGWDVGLVDDAFIVSMHVDPAPPGGTTLTFTFEFTFAEAYSDTFIEHPPGPLLNDIMDYFRLHAGN